MDRLGIESRLSILLGPSRRFHVSEHESRLGPFGIVTGIYLNDQSLGNEFVPIDNTSSDYLRYKKTMIKALNWL